jgi:MoaA/NifB/PqqE/SkfB family radical SAM enzyme
MRCELLVTDACNFRCPYCRSRHDGGHISWEQARSVLDLWIADDIRNVRFSGGEPTLWPHLAEAASYMPHSTRVAISTNGSASRELYSELLSAGVSDFSVSFDACCSSTGELMANREGVWDTIVGNVQFLAERAYVSVGVVVTDDNIGEVGRTVELAHSLGVADIRIIPAAQYGATADMYIPAAVADVHPILKYRVANLSAGRPFRGLSGGDSHHCSLVLDDMAVSDGDHFPCIIYLREGGQSIGAVGENMRTERAVWSATHDTHRDPICKANCLDVCVDYNNRFRELHAPC